MSNADKPYKAALSFVTEDNAFGDLTIDDIELALEYWEAFTNDIQSSMQARHKQLVEEAEEAEEAEDDDGLDDKG